MSSIWSQGKPFWMNVHPSSLNSYPGHNGTMVHIQHFGIHRVTCHQKQGDPLGLLLFELMLQRIISAVDIDVECIQMLFHAWFLDDGVLAETKSAVL